MGKRIMRYIPIAVSLASLLVSGLAFQYTREANLRAEKRDAYERVYELASMSKTTLNQTDDARALLDAAQATRIRAKEVACSAVASALDRFFDSFRAILRDEASTAVRQGYYQQRNDLYRLLESDIDGACE